MEELNNRGGGLAIYRYPLTSPFPTIDWYPRGPWRLRAAQSASDTWFDVASFNTKQDVLNWLQMCKEEIERMKDVPGTEGYEFGLVLSRSLSL